MGRVSESSASATRAIVQAIGEILTLRAKTFDAGLRSIGFPDK
jgi:hypothetical protein